MQDALTADRMATLQAFRDLFSTEVLRPGDEVAIGRVTLLFSDLKGSTALYEAVGDAAAYRLVREHFAYLAAIIREHDGAIVKTIGDAVMAAFHDPLQGLRAAIAMQERVAELQREEPRPIVLKLGLHEGPCIAVTLNDRLDYFGQTVNLTARLQGESRGRRRRRLGRRWPRSTGAAAVLAGHRPPPRARHVARGVGARGLRPAARRSSLSRGSDARRDVQHQALRPAQLRGAQRAVRPRLHYLEPRLSAETALLAHGFPAVCLFVNDVCDAAVLEIAGRRRHAAGGAALRRLQQCRPRRRGRPRHPRRARAGLFAARRGRVHGRPDPDPEPADPPRLQPHPREQFRARRPAGLRPARQDRRRHRHRQDRRPGRARAAGWASAARCWPTTSPPNPSSRRWACPTAAGRARRARRHHHAALPADPADAPPGRPAACSQLASPASCWSTPAAAPWSTPRR